VNLRKVHAKAVEGAVMSDQRDLSLDDEHAAEPVECLGMTFQNDKARREHFLALLAEKLRDPQEDEKLLMYYDVARMRLGDD